MLTDQKSLDLLNKLHPSIRQSAIDAMEESCRITPKGVHPTITQTLRTFAESDALYAKGRTTKGSIVTNAKGGQSFHNYGLALDFVLIVDGKTPWKVDANWMKVVSVFKKHGFVWGGDFKSIPDAPHFEKTSGYTWRQLLERYNSGKTFTDGGVKYVTL